MSDLGRRAVDIVPPDGLDGKLALGRPLRVKLGVDPTAPDIHLGHTVALQKLREFQDAGHIAVLIIGDWTARVGDPSGRSSTRPMLSAEEIDANARTYREQAATILDADRLEVRPNGEWFAGMGLEPLFRLAATTTVNQLLRRDDFANRLGEQRPISVLELLYPLMQAYDSVAIDADIELGGTDQLFNLMLGREVMQAYGKPPQVALTMPILPGTDGVARMSKSTGNYIGVSEPATEQFGKTMSIPDEALATFYGLLAPGEPGPSGHPNLEKRRLGRLIADRFHGSGSGAAAEEAFDRVHKRHEAPEDMTEITVSPGTVHLPELLATEMGVGSRSDARRLIQQGGVSIDGVPVRDLDVDATALDGRIVKAGKRRFARVRVSP
jgi:tyrosyl-tRNA synthetase